MGMSYAGILATPESRRDAGATLDLRKAGESCSREDACKNQIGKLWNQVLRLQVAFRLVPLIDPIDHAEQGEGGGARADFAFCPLTFILHFRHEVFEEVDVRGASP
jgi:hypothetical protein